MVNNSRSQVSLLNEVPINDRVFLEAPENPKGNIASLPSHTAVRRATFLGSPVGRCRETRLYQYYSTGTYPLKARQREAK